MGQTLRSGPYRIRKPVNPRDSKRLVASEANAPEEALYRAGTATAARKQAKPSRPNMRSVLHGCRGLLFGRQTGKETALFPNVRGLFLIIFKPAVLCHFSSPVM